MDANTRWLNKHPKKGDQYIYLGRRRPFFQGSVDRVALVASLLRTRQQTWWPPATTAAKGRIHVSTMASIIRESSPTSLPHYSSRHINSAHGSATAATVCICTIKYASRHLSEVAPDLASKKILRATDTNSDRLSHTKYLKFQSVVLKRGTRTVLRGKIVIRIHHINKNLYIPVFLLQ